MRYATLFVSLGAVALMFLSAYGADVGIVTVSEFKLACVGGLTAILAQLSLTLIIE